MGLKGILVEIWDIVGHFLEIWDLENMWEHSD